MNNQEVVWTLTGKIAGCTIYSIGHIIQNVCPDGQKYIPRKGDKL